MNYIDQKFKHLMKDISTQSEEELFLFVKEHYLAVPFETRKSMEDFFSKFSYWGSLDFEENDFTEIHNSTHMLKEHVIDFQDFYQDLEDYRSKTLLFAILNNWYCYDFQTLKSVMESTYLHYFDLDILPSLSSEIFVDLGAYTGDTILDAIRCYGKDAFDRIYAYEMSKSSVSILKSKELHPNLFVRQCAVSSKVGMGSIMENDESASANVLSEGSDISITTLDEDIKEKITLIKMDIEGSEMDAIFGAREHIIEDKPKMMVSVYHGFQDIIGVWKILKEYNPRYHFFLRYYGGPIFPTEIVLYAI